MKILVALDNSEYSFQALQKATAMAKLENASLTIITVYPDFLEVAEIPQKVRDVMFQQASEIMTKGKSLVEKAGITPITVIEAGPSASDNIVDYAKKNGIDLIVMGHKSKSGIERLLVGSVAGKVVAYAPCSVLVVR
jgi:nucleotide-binding universal stress UspA family protein